MVVSAARSYEELTVVWHDLECGGYRADLPLWRSLAADAGGAPVLDLGAGAGRVTLDLARCGYEVTALDRDSELLGALTQRAAGLPVEPVCADARSFELARADHGLCVVPMQTIQLLGDGGERLSLLRCARRHLRDGALLALAIVTQVEGFDCAAGDHGPSPETLLARGVRYESRAVRVEHVSDGVLIERERSVERVRSRAAPWRERDVVLLRNVRERELWEEGRAAGFEPAATLTVAETADHAGSLVVTLRAC